MRGFGLLEAVVALVIASIALTVMFDAVGDTFRAGELAARYSEAVVRARSRMVIALADEAPVPGDQEGDDGAGFRWHLRIRTIIADAARPAEGQADAQTLYEVSVWITWRRGEGDSEVRLDSERLGRPAGTS